MFALLQLAGPAAVHASLSTPPPTLPTWSTYVLGAVGDSCAAACAQWGGRVCVPHVQTNDSDAIFARLGLVCSPGHAGDGSRNGTWWARSAVLRGRAE